MTEKGYLQFKATWIVLNTWSEKDKAYTTDIQ
jgi:hypothetical protein